MLSKTLFIAVTLATASLPIIGSAQTIPIQDRYYGQREHRDPRREELRRLDFEIQEARGHRDWHRVHRLEERREHLRREIEYERGRR